LLYLLLLLMMLFVLLFDFLEGTVKMFILVDVFFQAEDGIRDDLVTGVQTCALPILVWLLV